jgi:NAD(P) transhydrogenase subunit alpha
VRIAVARESAPGESRVALVPELVGKLTAAGYEVAVQPGAGAGSMFSDETYAAAGAGVTQAALEGAEVVISVQPLDPDLVGQLGPGAATLSFFPVAARPEDVATRRDRGLTTFGMEYVPRISRAQSMDALSSQSLVAGYRGAIVAAGRLRQFFPLSMTAAGTVKPAQVVVLGAGVAGLQAIATCRRLGAVVKGYDVRAAAAEEIRSMGAQAIDLALPTLEGAGGYAREMTEERAQRQRELLTPYVAAADALITTAAVPGRTAPVLVTADMVRQMRPGSVVVDLAAESGGNVEGVVAGSVINVDGIQLWGGANIPSQMPAPASRLYAQNVLNVIMLMTREGRFAPDFSDEIVAAMCVTHAGEVRRS